jgi:hypothetical protein
MAPTLATTCDVAGGQAPGQRVAHTAEPAAALSTTLRARVRVLVLVWVLVWVWVRGAVCRLLSRAPGPLAPLLNAARARASTSTATTQQRPLATCHSLTRVCLADARVMAPHPVVVSHSWRQVSARWV